MASRVNVKFALALAVGLIAITGAGVFLAVNAIKKGGDQLVSAGDKAASEGNWSQAVVNYSKAVNKDQRNGAWIRKWIDAMEHWTPKTRQEFEDAYFKNYLAALKALTDADPKDTANFRKLQEQRYQLIQRSGGGSLAAWERFATDVDDLLSTFKGDDKGKDELRRYRGLAVQGMYQFNNDLDQSKIDGAIADLTAAILAKPDDAEVAMALSAFDLANSDRASKRGDETTKAKLVTQSRDRLEKFLQDNPKGLRVATMLTRLDTLEAMTKSGGRATMQELILASRPRIKTAVESILAQKPEEVEAPVALLIASTAQVALEGGQALSEQVIEHVRKGHMSDPQFLIGLANIELGRGNTENVLALGKQILALPDKPVGLDGIQLFEYRNLAIQRQADATIAAWEREKDATKKTALVEDVRALRNNLAARMGEGAVSVMSVDGRLAYLEGNINGARTTISAYNDQTGRSDPRMLLIEGEILLQMGQAGAAKTTLQRVIQLDRNNLSALVKLGGIEAQQNNFKDAAQYYGLAAAIRPDNTELAKLAESAKEFASGNIKDKVLKVLKEASDASMGVGGDLGAATRILRQGLAESPGDSRLVQALVQMLIAAGDKAGAIKVVDDAIAANPADKNLPKFKEALAADPLQAALTSIENAPLTDWQKHLSRFEVYMRVGKKDEAKTSLAEAVKLAPEEASVIEARFNDATVRGDMTEMEKVTAIAERKNIDRVGGLLYRARLQIAQKKIADATGSLREVVNKDKQSLLGWRLLGALELDQGRPQQAVDALKRAVEIKPDDIASINGYIRALFTSGQTAEALAFALKTESRAAGDPDFAEMLLTLLEVAPGGDVNRAISARQKRLERMPGDASNKSQLASMLINARRFDEAKTLVDQIRRDKPEDAVGAQLQAGLEGMKGNVAGAVQIMDTFIKSLPKEKQEESLYINGSRLLMNLGQPEQAIKFLESGKSIQNKETALIDRELGDLQFNAGNMKEAVAAYRNVLDFTKKDENNAVRMRMMEANLRLSEFKEMDKLVAEMGPSAANSSTVMMLQAEAAWSQNDRVKALALYDQAVAVDPKNPICYLKRGDFKATDPRLLGDAEADYEQMLRLDPSSTVALVRLTRLYRETGRDELAVTTLRRAVSADSGNEQLWLALGTMFVELRRPQEALATYTSAVNQFGGAAVWRMRTADMAARTERWDKCVEQLAEVWKERKSPDVAIPYAEALLNNGDAAGAYNLLRGPDIAVDKDLGLRMLYARVLAKQGKTADAAREIAGALGMVDQNSREQANVFFAGLTQMYPKLPDQLAALAKLESNGAFKGFMALRTQDVRLRSDDTRGAALTSMQELAEKSDDKRVKAAAWSFLGALSYRDNKFEDARACFEKGLASEPDNAELCNNMAYVLAAKLDRGADAVTFAEKAVKIVPNNSGFQDTLGSAYLATGRCEDAVKALTLALSMALNDGDRAPVHLHVAKAKLCLKDKSGAQNAADRARELLSKIPALNDQYSKDLRELQTSIDAQ